MIRCKGVFQWILERFSLQGGHFLFEILFNGQHEVFSVKEHALLNIGQAMDASSQILGHFARVHAVNASGLQSDAELGQVGVVIQFCSVSEATGPSINTSDGVSGGLLALLVLSVVPSDSAVSGLSLDSFTIGAHQNGGHETQRAVALGNGVGLHVTVVVLAGPDELTRGFEALSDHVVDQPVFIPDACGIEILFVLFFVDILEDVLEAAVVPFQDGVLGGHVERPFLLQGLNKTGMSKVGDTLKEIVNVRKKR